MCLFYIPISGSFSVIDVDPREQDILTADEKDQHTQEAGDADDQTESDDPLHPQVKPLDQVTSQKRAPSPADMAAYPEKHRSIFHTNLCFFYQRKFTELYRFLDLKTILHVQDMC